jgi:hypothetical protein
VDWYGYVMTRSWPTLSYPPCICLGGLSEAANILWGWYFCRKEIIWIFLDSAPADVSLSIWTCVCITSVFIKSHNEHRDDWVTEVSGYDMHFFFLFYLYFCCSHLEHRHQWNAVSLQFLNFRESVRLLGRGISPSQGRRLHKTTQTQNKRRQTYMP